ncbi:uncharacterized protein AB9X84_014651 [Acanthopagrus schlegelii]
MADQGEMKSQEEDLSSDIKDWSKHQVRQWALKLDNVDDSVAETLFKQDINGCSILLLDATDLKEMGVTVGPAKLVIHARDEVVKLKREEPASCRNQPGRPCKPYPFHRYHDPYRYMESSILDITESGASDFIEPCHEYKAFINTTDETKMNKFTYEVIRFAAACINSRTNGTIHFGIGDKPDFMHGQVLGVVVEDKEAYANDLKSAIDGYFEHKHKQTAQMCIKPPRFVGVLNKNMTSSDKCVIEVDIVPDSAICAANIYHTSNMDTKKAKKKAKGKETVKPETKPQKQFFVRDGGSSRDLLAPTTGAKPLVEYNQFVDRIPQLAQLRKQSEEKHLNVIKSSTQGWILSKITGVSLSLDKSHFEWYVIITNKSHPVQLESLGFLAELNPTTLIEIKKKTVFLALAVIQCFFDLCLSLTGAQRLGNSSPGLPDREVTCTWHVCSREADISLSVAIGGSKLLRRHCLIRDLYICAEGTNAVMADHGRTVQSQEEDPSPGTMDQSKHPVRSRKQPGRRCKPHPFGKYQPANRYIENNILDVTESGASDFIEPCHEYKAFINTTDETKMNKFTYEVIRFAAACINSRTNGTIHFGIGDKPNFIHGQVLGVVVEDTEAYANELKSAIDGYFEHKHKQTAQICIKPPRFVGVLNKNMTSSDKCVIEVDIVPESKICGENIFQTFNMVPKFFVRDGGSSRDLLAPTTGAKPKVEYNQFVNRIPQLAQLRKQSEEKHPNRLQC